MNAAISFSFSSVFILSQFAITNISQAIIGRELHFSRGHYIC